MKHLLPTSFILSLQDVIVLETKPNSGPPMLLKNIETIFCFCSSGDVSSGSVSMGTIPRTSFPNIQRTKLQTLNAENYSAYFYNLYVLLLL